LCALCDCFVLVVPVVSVGGAHSWSSALLAGSPPWLVFNGACLLTKDFRREEIKRREETHHHFYLPKFNPFGFNSDPLSLPSIVDTSFSSHHLLPPTRTNQSSEG